MIQLHDYLDYYAKITPLHAFSNFEGRIQTYQDAAKLTAGIAQTMTTAGRPRGPSGDPVAQF